MSDGSITAHIQPIEGKVVITFPTSVTYLSMPPDQAEAFANIVLGAARAARAERPMEQVAPPGTKPS